MIGKISLLPLLVLGGTLLAAANPVFEEYEAVRQGLLADSLPAIQKAASELAAAARSVRQPAVAKQAGAVATARDLAAARAEFSALSDQMIKYRATLTGERPAIAYCAMEKKSWLQPRGNIGNPYLPTMRACGEFKNE